MSVLVQVVDVCRDDHGVEPVCRVLTAHGVKIAPSSYYAAKKRESEPSERAVRHALMAPVLFSLWVANRKVYGAHKLWLAAKRAGHEIGRD